MFHFFLFQFWIREKRSLETVSFVLLAFGRLWERPLTLTSRSVVSNSLRPYGLQPTRLLCPWDFPGKRTGVGCHFLLQAIFLTQGLNLGLLPSRQMLYPLSHEGIWEEQLFAKLDNEYLLPLSWTKGLVLGIWFCKSDVLGRR